MKVPYFYSDAAFIRLNHAGFRFDFGLSPLGKAESLQLDDVEIVSSVGMSAEQALMLYELLGRQLASYEEQAGPIRRPPNPKPNDKESIQ